MTARTSAHLTSQSDHGFKTLTQARGLEGSKIFYESHAAAIDRIETVAAEERIECHFRRVNGYPFPAIGKDPAEELTPEFEATKKVGMPIERQTGLPSDDVGSGELTGVSGAATERPRLQQIFDLWRERRPRWPSAR
jgi:hypothetical protein